MKKDLETATAQVHKTLDYYNTIMTGGAGRHAQAVQKPHESHREHREKRAANVTKRVEEMEAEAHSFFGEWTQSLQGITSEDLKKRSQDRLNKTRVHFSEILAAGRRAGAVFNPFMGALKDQVVYLGYELERERGREPLGGREKTQRRGRQAVREHRRTSRTSRASTFFSLKPE